MGSEALLAGVSGINFSSDYSLHILRVCPWENQAGGDNAQITDFAQTWYNWWVWWDINLDKK